MEPVPILNLAVKAIHSHEWERRLAGVVNIERKSEPPMNPTTHPETEINELLGELWQRYLPSTQERLEVLAQAVRICGEGNLDEAARAEAQAAAHKLSGNLGMFGHKEAGEVAGSMEHIFIEFSQDKAARLDGLMQRLCALLEPHLLPR